MLGLISDWAGPGSVFGMLAGAVWMVLTGRLVSRRVHEQALAAATTRAEDWKAAHLAEVKRGEMRDAQMAEVLAFVRRTREAA